MDLDEHDKKARYFLRMAKKHCSKDPTIVYSQKTGWKFRCSGCSYETDNREDIEISFNEWQKEAERWN